MRIGLFRAYEIENIKELLEFKGIEFELIIDKAIELEILKDLNKKATISPRQMAGHLDLSIIFFEIADQDFEKIKEDLEKYGIVAQSDGAVPKYYNELSKLFPEEKPVRKILQTDFEIHMDYLEI